ncbi:MAG TPA: N-6 DNA methylase [Saprospiraceae bacterium]|nr:N-6 DNA methylase [Saprospiraceae bacterium]
MNIRSKEYFSGLSQLEMINADGNSFGLIHTSELENSTLNYYQRLSLEKAKKVGADAVYFRNFPDPNRPSKPQLYIFDFTSNEEEIVEIHKNIWSSTEVRLYLIITKTEIKFFNSSKPVEQTKGGALQVSPFETIKIAGDAIKKYKEYSAKKFDNGSFWEETKYDFGYSETAYEKLITELKNTRNRFLKEIELDKVIASKLLVLGILVKYLEERVDIDESGNETRVFTADFFNQEKFGYSSDFTDTILKGNQYTLNLFEYLSNHFNGKIFYLSEDYKEQIKDKDLSPLANFLSGVLDNNQFVFWRLYSFNYLPIELISSIYEMFLEADNSTGVAYTPTYLVSFMIDECMPINQPKENFKILDPACGSGIFLVSAYKRIIDWWRVSNYEKTGEWILPGKENLNELKKLLKESIYGIDIAKEAVDLAIFSLSLTLCDILSPKVIWENLRFDNLSDNVVDSDFFDWYHENTDKKFDLVIGNPPFIEYGLRETKINYLISGLNFVEQVPNNQSALLFTILGMNLVKKENGLLSFILPSGPLLYNNSQKPINFRKWLFSEYNIPQIIDFTYLSNVLFKNKGNEKNVAVSAFFLENKVPDKNPIYHITVKKLKTAKERQYFEIDHYDFHKVSKTDAIQNPFIWKSNLLGGGRLVSFINKLTDFQSLKDFLDTKKGWIYGDGFIKGKNDEELVKSDFEKKKGGYSEPAYLLNLNYVEPEDFSEKGITKTQKNTSKYFQWPRNENIFMPPLLLIKKNIGSNSIPVFFSDDKLGYKNEIIGIHSPLNEREELEKVYHRIKDNPLYRFYILTTSARSGVSRSTKTTLQKDILGIPFPEDEKDIELTKFDEILIRDTLKYGIEFLGKDTNVKVLDATSEKELISFGVVFTEVLNSLFETESKKYLQKSIYRTESFICSVFEYGNNTNHKPLKTEIEIENHIAELVYNKMGTSYRINRVVKIYDDDLIYLIKPKELRYWLESIALRDADETIVDLYNAGY